MAPPALETELAVEVDEHMFLGGGGIMGVTRVLVGDLFGSRAQTLVNTVNCVGVMGKGIALEFKTRFPDMYRDYEDLCRRGEMRLGRPHLYRHLTQPWVLLFPTKDHWRSVARLDDIVRGLEYLKSHYREWGITSLAVPPLARQPRD